MDFTDILASIESAPMMSALAAIAAILILPGVSKWGYNQVLAWFGDDDDDEDALWEDSEWDTDYLLSAYESYDDVPENLRETWVAARRDRDGDDHESQHAAAGGFDDEDYE